MEGREGERERETAALLALACYCRECGGSGIFEHDRRRIHCTECMGAGICRTSAARAAARNAAAGHRPVVHAPARAPVSRTMCLRGGAHASALRLRTLYLGMKGRPWCSLHRGPCVESLTYRFYQFIRAKKGTVAHSFLCLFFCN